MAKATKELREKLYIPESVEGCTIVDIAFDFGSGAKYDLAGLGVGEAMAITPDKLSYVKGRAKAKKCDNMQFFIRFNDIRTIVFICRRS